jgi:hypothetical protein
MRTRRGFLKSASIASVGAVTLSSCHSTTRHTQLTADYSVLDEVLAKPVLKRGLFPDPVMIDTLELLRFEGNFMLRQKNRWVVLGSGSTPRVWYKAASAAL